ncbi:hypothetical protein B5S30_g3218 [[Candida] boidinii]|nr:hypothetical protein B5S30_g3218 [[Candida] boidinii]
MSYECVWSNSNESLPHNSQFKIQTVKNKPLKFIISVGMDNNNDLSKSTFKDSKEIKLNKNSLIVKQEFSHSSLQNINFENSNNNSNNNNNNNNYNDRNDLEPRGFQNDNIQDDSIPREAQLNEHYKSLEIEQYNGEYDDDIEISSDDNNHCDFQFHNKDNISSPSIYFNENYYQQRDQDQDQSANQNLSISGFHSVNGYYSNRNNEIIYNQHNENDQDTEEVKENSELFTSVIDEFVRSLKSSTIINGYNSWLPGVSFSVEEAYFYNAFIKGFMVSVSPQFAHRNLLPGSVFVPQGTKNQVLRDIFFACGAAFLCWKRPEMVRVAEKKNTICLTSFSTFMNNNTIRGNEDWILVGLLCLCLKERYIGENSETTTIHLAVALRILRFWLRNKKIEKLNQMNNNSILNCENSKKINQINSNIINANDIQDSNANKSSDSRLGINFITNTQDNIQDILEGFKPLDDEEMLTSLKNPKDSHIDYDDDDDDDCEEEIDLDLAYDNHWNDNGGFRIDDDDITIDQLFEREQKLLCYTDIESNFYKNQISKAKKRNSGVFHRLLHEIRIPEFDNTDEDSDFDTATDNINNNNKNNGNLQELDTTNIQGQDITDDGNTENSGNFPAMNANKSVQFTKFVIDDSERTVLESFIYNYSVNLLNCDKNSLRIMTSPFDVYDEFKQYLYSPLYNCITPWMNNPVMGAAVSGYEIAAKTSWLRAQFPLNTKNTKTARYLYKMAKYQVSPLLPIEVKQSQPAKVVQRLQDSCLVNRIVSNSCVILLIKLLNPEMSQDEPEVQKCVDLICQDLHKISYRSPCSLICTWPILIAGAAAITKSQKDYFIENLDTFGETYRLKNMSTIGKFLKESWGTDENPGVGWDILLHDDLSKHVFV